MRRRSSPSGGAWLRRRQTSRSELITVCWHLPSHGWQSDVRFGKKAWRVGTWKNHHFSPRSRQAGDEPCCYGLLRRRFGESIPEDVRQAVEAQDDHDILDAWFDRALTAATLDELRPTLALVNG